MVLIYFLIRDLHPVVLRNVFGSTLQFIYYLFVVEYFPSVLYYQYQVVVQAVN